MTEQKIPKETVSRARVVFSVVYFLLGLLPILLFRKHMFYLNRGRFVEHLPIHLVLECGVCWLLLRCVFTDVS